MFKFQMSVATNNSHEVAVAQQRFASMANVQSVMVSDDGKHVVAEAEMAIVEKCRLKLTGWAKDNFGMHPTLNPSVSILS